MYRHGIVWDVCRIIWGYKTDRYGNFSIKRQAGSPTPEVLNSVLHDSYPAFEEWDNVLSGLDIKPEWNYYKDGNAWLCKMMFKKKNLGWIGVFDGYFKVSFYFTEKHLNAIVDSDISDTIKEDFYNAKPSGRLLPMTVAVTDKEKLKEVLPVLLFKKNLK